MASSRGELPINDEIDRLKRVVGEQEVHREVMAKEINYLVIEGNSRRRSLVG